jgi:osmotically-inducible protein OsmY
MQHKAVFSVATMLCASLALCVPALASADDAKGAKAGAKSTASDVKADAKDAWITTKAKVKLLTADDVSVTAVGVDTSGGVVTLHGKVGSEAERKRAEEAVRRIDGVREVRNLLQVVPESRKDLVKEKDESIKDKVSKCLSGDATLKDVKVASVDDGVVLLSGDVDSAREELRAIEAVRSCTSVRRVASELKTRRP